MAKSKGHSSAASFEAACAELIQHLQAQRSEIEETIYAHVRTVSAPAQGYDAVYEAGLHATIASVVEYVFTAIRRGEKWHGPIPSPAIAQVRRAVQYGIGPEIVVLRYLAGQRLLSEVIMREAAHCGFSGLALCDLSKLQEGLLEHVIESITSEYRQELERAGRSAAQHRREIVQKLLSHKQVDLTEFDYEFDGVWHMGVVAIGERVAKTLSGIAENRGRRVLYVPCGEGTVWAWFAGPRKSVITGVDRLLSDNGDGEVLLAVGAPRQGVDGWRLTHNEAQAALSVAMRKPKPLTQCSDVALEAAVLRHEAAAQSLLDHYLSPLDSLRGGGSSARNTLQAYFTSKRNASLAAKKLNVTRQTIDNRLRAIEERIGRPLHTCYAELEIALRVYELYESTGAKVVSASARGSAKTNGAGT
jgi:PucR C-terminal helix-turn-helix domain/GGDEF-like domain